MRWLPRSGALAALLLGLSTFAGGCVATPQPNPPNIVVEIDADEVFSEPTNWGGVDLFGNPGAIDPPEALLRIYDLDNGDPPTDVVVEDDGSFHAEVEGLYGDEFRLQAILDESRSEALDVVVEIDGMHPPPRPLEACLTSEPTTWVEVPEGGAAVIELRNECDEALSIDRVSLRFDPTSFAVGDEPVEIAPRSAAELVVEHTPGEGGVEDVLSVVLSAPSVADPDRRHFTLVGTAR